MADRWQPKCPRWEGIVCGLDGFDSVWVAHRSSGLGEGVAEQVVKVAADGTGGLYAAVPSGGFGDGEGCGEAQKGLNSFCRGASVLRHERVGEGEADAEETCAFGHCRFCGGVAD